MPDGVRGPHSGVTVGLQLGSDTLALGSSAAAARLQRSQQVLHVVSVFVGEDVSLGERAAPRPNWVRSSWKNPRSM